MDDFNVSSLYESKSEWGSRLLNMLTPLMIEGLRSIFEESCKLCRDNDEMGKYLMTFQNLLTRIPKWNPTIIENERKRISEKSGCTYLQDLVTCVHIIQLKLLTAIRAGNKQKKIDIDIPKLDDFIHKAYINCARKIYKNVYLFELGIEPLQIQKNNRELEILVQESILNAVRESIPVEAILRAYMDETIEEDVTEEVKEEIVEDPIAKKEKEIEKEVKEIIEQNGGKISEPSQINELAELAAVSTIPKQLSFNDTDKVIDSYGSQMNIEAPKTIERLEEVYRGEMSYPDDDGDDDSVKLKISDENIALDGIESFDGPESDPFPELVLDDFDVLE